MAATLVTLDQAKAHLYQTWATGDPREADLQLKLDAAEAAILDYINATEYWRTITPPWTASTAPAFVKVAILDLCGEVWRFRGDDSAADGTPPRDPLTDFSPVIVGLLRRTRDPVCA